MVFWLQVTFSKSLLSSKFTYVASSAGPDGGLRRAWTVPWTLGLNRLSKVNVQTFSKLIHYHSNFLPMILCENIIQKSCLSWAWKKISMKHIDTNILPFNFCPENVCCFLRPLHIFKCTSDFFWSWKGTLWSLIRLLLREQSDLGP